MKNLPLKLILIIALYSISFGLIISSLWIIKTNRKEELITSNEPSSQIVKVTFSQTDLDYKIMIYKDNNFVSLVSSSETIELAEGIYDLVIIDPTKENLKVNQIENIIYSDSGYSVNLSESIYILNQPMPTPTLISAEVKFQDPLINCPDYVFARGFQPWHGGVDLVKAGGCEISSAADGDVTFAGWKENGDGYTVIVEHANGYVTEYKHGNGEFQVQIGDKVISGQAIMYMGCTGNCTGTHLHFELSKDDVLLNPEDYINFLK